jgi:hypothetical protein
MIVCPVADIAIVRKSPPGGGNRAGFSLGKFWGINFRSGNPPVSRMFLACVKLHCFVSYRTDAGGSIS